MKRLFEVSIDRAAPHASPTTFQVVERDADRAIRKARAAWRRKHYNWRGGWLAHSLTHKGPVV